MEKIHILEKFLRAVLMNLSKAFDSITHDLMIAKMHAYGFSIVTVTLLYSFLQRRKQNVRINNTHFIFQSYHLAFLKVQYLGHCYSTYLLMIYISG